MKVVLDSNVLISAFVAKGLCADLFREVVASHQLLLSDYIVDEVTERLSHKFRIPAATVRGIGDLLRRFVVTGLHEAQVEVIIRDPDNLPVVGLAVAAAADLLITGDRDLLDVARQLPVKVVSPREYYES